MTTRRSLDGVELVSSVVRHDHGLVQLWYTEWLMPEIGAVVNSDQLGAVDTGKRERAVRMVFEAIRQTGERAGAVSRIACQLGTGDQLGRQTPAPYWVVRGSRWSCFRRSFRSAVGPFHATVRKMTVEAAEARRSESLRSLGGSGRPTSAAMRRKGVAAQLTRHRVSLALDAVDSRSGTRESANVQREPEHPAPQTGR